MAMARRPQEEIVTPEEFSDQTPYPTQTTSTETDLRGQSKRSTTRREIWTPEFVPWRYELRPAFLETWKATGDGAEHLSVIGTTGSGKTTLALSIGMGKLAEDEETRMIILMNKKRDTTMTELINQGTVGHIRKWDDLAYKHRVKRIICLWPDYPENLQKAREVAKPVFSDALNGLMHEGDWIIYIDEASYMIEQLGLRTTFDEFWNSGRSNGLALIAGGQRPVWISKSQTSQHSWFITFYIKALEDRRSVGEAVGDRRGVPEAIRRLDKHEFFLIHSDDPQNEAYMSDVAS